MGDQKLINQLLSRSPVIEDRLAASQIVDDVLDRKILTAKKSIGSGGTYGNQPIAQINAVTNAPIINPAEAMQGGSELRYLPKGKMEEASEYKKRCAMTPFFPQTPKILNERQGAIFSEPPELIGTERDNPQIKDFFDHATAQGQSFMWACVQVADLLQRHGCCALLVDREPLPLDVVGRDNITVAEKVARNLGAPRVAIYSLQNVLWAEFTREGLAWIKLLEETTEQAAWDAKPVNVKTVRIIDKQNITSYRILDDKEVGEPVVVAHGFNRVPVKFGKAFGDQDNKLGHPALQESAEADVASTRILSDIIWNLFVLGNPLLLFQTNRKDDELGDVVTNKYVVLKGAQGNNEPEDMRYCQLDGTGINLMMMMHERFKSIHEKGGGTASGVRTNSGPVEQSGISRAWKFKTSEERVLFCLTRALEEIFNDVLDMVAEIIGIDPDNIAVKFNEKFDIAQPKDALLVTQGIVQIANQYGLLTLAKAALRNMVGLVGTLSQEDIEKVEEEINALAVVASSTPAPVTTQAESSATDASTAVEEGIEEEDESEAA